MTLGLYIHIPFCHARCGYCDFVTFTGKEDQRDAYVEALCREIRLYGLVFQSPFSCSRSEWEKAGMRALTLHPLPPSVGEGIKSKNIATIFFGGGTPSVLDPLHLCAIFKAMREQLPIDSDAEITLEANPESITDEKLAVWREVGINRLSIGLQAYDDALLKTMGRLHTVEQFCQAYARARAAGFSNINIDLIYGFPNQTLEGWRHTLESTLALAPEHVSLYSLQVEEHTPFGAQGVEVDADVQADMYQAARNYLAQQGFEHYEISNFARPRKACRHNLIYWRQQDYLGLGVGAVGCVGGRRWQNHKNLPAYFKALSVGSLPRASEETLDAPTQKFERLMLGLRLREGLEWGEESNPHWLTERDRLAAQGQLEEVHPGTWRIPDPYVSLTNQILLPFL